MAGRVRVLGGFAAFGAFWGAWGATLPAVQEHAGVDDGQLGHRAAVHRRRRAGLDAPGRDARRPLGRARRSRRRSPPSAAAAVLPGLATSTASLCAALLVLGATSGAVDVAINAEGVSSEAASGRPC